MSYRTPGGLDEGEYPSLKMHENRFEGQGVKSYRYGHTLNLRGGNCDTKIMDELYRRRNNNESIVITVTGPPGSGKTYFGIRLGQKLDSKFHINDLPTPPPNEDDSHVAFSRDHLAYLTGKKSPFERDQVVILDESHFGVGARSWQDSDQQEVTNYLASIRSKGFVLILIVLHTDMVDKLLRNFVINYEMSMNKRGRALVYRRFYPPQGHKVWRNRLGPLEMLLPDEGLCNFRSCLRCDYLHKPEGKRCMTIRAIYERRKKEFLDSRSEEEEEGVQERRKSAAERHKGRCEKAISISESLKGENGSYEVALIRYHLNVDRQDAQNVKTFLEAHDRLSDAGAGKTERV